MKSKWFGSCAVAWVSLGVCLSQSVFAGMQLLYPRSDVKVGSLCKGRVTKCGSAVDVGIAPNEPWSGVALTLPKTVDLSVVQSAVAVVSNRTDRPLKLRMHIKTPGVHDDFLHAAVTLAPFAGGEIVACPAVAKRRIASFAVAGLRDYDKSKDKALDLTRIGVIHVYRDRGPEPAAFTLAGVRLCGTASVPKPLPDEKAFYPFVDRFGQFAHETWPGKTSSEDDLRKRLAVEERELAALPESAIPGSDRFGGWEKGPQLKATGQFRTEKVDGRWWFVDPDGHLFFSLGVDCVHFSARTGVTGREKFFAELPKRDDVLFASCWGRQGSATVRGFYHDHYPFETFDFVRANLIRKYGKRDCLPDAAALSVRRMRSWGLNTIANWSAREPQTLAKVPYTDNFSTRSRPIRGNDGFWRKFPDVFAPEFKANAEADAKKTAARSGRDPWCLGWFVDNELSWGGDDADLANDVLASPDSQPAKVAFLKILREKGIATNAVPRAELVAFTRAIADRYFAVLRDAIKAAAPGRLYLGCRFAWVPPTVLLSAAEHCDVVTGNIYQKDPTAIRLPDGMRDRPYLSGEFHFGALDRGLLHTGLVPTASQADRADHFRRYVRAALADPRFVGVHWFQWRDQPLTGRFDGECYQIGLVDVADTPYPEMVAALRELASELYVPLTRTHVFRYNMRLFRLDRAQNRLPER